MFIAPFEQRANYLLAKARQLRMPLFTEATLLKMETFWTRRRKEWNNQPPAFWYVWWNPSVLLKPTEKYNNKLYLRVAVMSTIGTLLLVSIALCVGLIAGILISPQFLPIVRDPKNHATFIGILSREGFYQLPLYPLVVLSFSLMLNWPQFFFWNRRAKRLQKEGVIQAPLIVTTEPPAVDSTTWPPPPQRTIL